MSEDREGQKIAYSQDKGPAGKANSLIVWLRSGSIVDQMGRVFNLFALGLLVLLASAISGTMRIDTKVGSFAKLSYAYVETADSNLEVTRASRVLEMAPVRGLSADALDTALVNVRAASERIERLQQISFPGESPELASLSAIASELAALELELAELQDTSIGDAGRAARAQALATRLRAPEERLKEVRAVVDSRIDDLSRQGVAEVQRVLIILFVVGLSAIGLVYGGKRAIKLQIALPIARISDASKSIAGGETAMVVPESSRQDEIGTLARSLIILHRQQQATAALAVNELQQEKARQEEREAERRKQAELMQRLADQFEETIGDVATEVAAASSRLSLAATTLVKNVDHSSLQVEEVNSSLSEATNSMTGAAAATDQFALSISEVSSQAATSSARARKAAEAAASADKTISAMTDSADRISQIVEVITAIAQRTNLLALNASIEAARSAEAGRGFAVVANEVKELAAQTRRETAEVEVLITTMQNATGHSASALSTIAQEIIELETSARAIASAVDQQASAGRDLARAIDTAARNTQAASSSFGEVSAVTSTSKATAGELRDSSVLLSKQSDLLREHVSKFLEQVRAA